MAKNETPRFKIPFPKENAESWYDTHKDTLENVDARIFDNLEHLNLIHVELPDVEIQVFGPLDFRFIPHARAVWLSRTHHVEIEVMSRFVVLQPGGIIGAWLQSGAVGPQSVEWELWVGGMDLDASAVPMGYVNPDYSITWFNGTRLAVGVVTKLFSDSGLVTGDSKVKVTAADTTEDFLQPKIAAGAGIGLAVLNPGANEQLQITSTGGVAPTGWGRIFLDAVSGNDITGDGTIANPYQTLPVAVTCPRCAVPVSAADLLTPIEFIFGPGHYGPVLPALPTVVALPRRQNMKFSGTDVSINHIVEWGLYAGDWDAFAVNVSDFEPQFAIEGGVNAMVPPEAPGVPVDQTSLPTFFIAGVVAQKKDLGTSQIKGKYLRMRNAATWALVNGASGAAAATDSTGRMIFYAQDFVLTTYSAGAQGMIGGEREPLVSSESNIIFIHALNSRFNRVICANTVITRATRCEFAGMNRTIQASASLVPTPVTDGIISFAQPIACYDCTFKGNYRLGWDGVTLPMADGPRLDAASYRSWLTNEASGSTIVFDNLIHPIELHDQRSRFEGIFRASGGPVDLSAFTAAAPYPVVIDTHEFIDVGDFVHVLGAAPILFPRGGSFRFSFNVQWENQQFFFSNTIGAALRITPSGGGPSVDGRTVAYSDSDALGQRSACVLPPFEIALNDGDTVELVAWLHNIVTGFGPLLLLAGVAWLRVDRVQ